MTNMTKVNKLLSQAKVKLIREQPFFAGILLRRPLELTESIPTACITAKAEMKVNPAYIENMHVDQVVYLLCHEVLHVAGLHFLRMGHRNHEKWNYATDAWINDTLTVTGIGKAIPDGVNMPGSHKETSEAIYNKLPPQQQVRIGGIGSDLPSGGNGDSPIDADSPEGRAIKNQIKVEVGQAANVARAAGKLPGVLKEFTDQLLAENIPWHRYLEQYMFNLCKSPRQTWSKPNRRYRHIAYLPSADKEPMLEFAVVQLDVSGSITNELMAKYISHIEQLMDNAKPRRLLILWTDTKVQRTQTITHDEPNDIEHFVTFGGTDMEEGFNWLRDNEPMMPDVFICITDGETHFSSPPDFPVFWVIDNGYRKVEPPYGTTIYIAKE